MGLPETPAQCLCPLDRGGNNGSGSKSINDRNVHDAHDIDADDSKSLAGVRYSDQDNIQSSLPISPSPRPALRRCVSTTFYGGGDAQKCIDACRQGFLDSLSSSSSTSSPSLSDTCSLLSSNTAAQQELWQLYWCDSAFCGVWIDSRGGAGQDPNVDMIINQCQSIGFSLIYDPGPPPANYYCSSLLAAGPSANPCRNRAVATETQTKTATPTAAMTTTTNGQKSPAAAGTALATPQNSQHLTTAAGTPVAATSLSLGYLASAPAATGSPGANSSTDNDSSASESPSSLSRGPSAGVKAAIVVCIVVAVLLVAGIVHCVLRRRRSNMLGQQSYQHRRGGGCGNGTGGDGPSRQPSHGASNDGSIGLAARVRTTLFHPGHGRGTHRDEVPTPLISAANSCNSVRGVSVVDGQSTTQASPKQKRSRSSAAFWKARKTRTSQTLYPDPRTPPRTAERVARSVLPTFLARQQRERSISPPLTSLSPPPSPTQMSARGRPDTDADEDLRPGHSRNRASAANSGSSYYGYYGYNGNFVPYYFPSSPICAPTTNKLEPRRERTPTIRPSKQQEQQRAEQQKRQDQKHGFYNFQKAADGDADREPVPPLPPLPLPHSIFSTSVADGLGCSNAARGLRSSYGSYSTVTNASSTIIPATSLYGNAVTTDAFEPMMPLASITGSCGTGSSEATSSTNMTMRGPVSPVRPKRPHEGPLEIPGLVKPDPPPAPPVFHSYGPGGRSFSMPATAFSVPSAGQRSAKTTTRMTREEAILPPLPPPTRALPPPPSPPKQQDDVDSIESLELPPLLMRDDDEEEERGTTLRSWTAPRRCASPLPHGPSHDHDHNHNPKQAGPGSKPATTTASFSSTVSTSTASVLSSSTAETASTATTVTSMPSTQPPRQLFSYASPSTASSSLTIRLSASQTKTNTPSTDDSGTDDSLFPSRAILDSDDF
ncbi:hypothetical protein HMPREF1624_08637 [Sporothrix schenckii ATCC 58251]|uniref:Uncharacterized protein n=1 Tax=Sporothrix schenckii (strain ATCC 58251 / de Perez 2211183) TaxID=1391915 RepID=U7PJ47_SPOS1|nr:hypothetical protein HMPREF1624_08637 [Sporothrix schenckii ATCC 58251]